MKYIKKLFIFIFAIVYSSTCFANPYISDVLKLPEWQVTTSSNKVKLLFSDSPEIVTKDGITYKDTVSGDVRVFLYHLNGTQEKKKMSVVLKNSTNIPSKVKVYRKGFAGPSANYLDVGKTAQFRWLNDNFSTEFTVPAKSAVELDDELSNTIIDENMLINAIYDFYTEKPLTVSVVMLPYDKNSISFEKKAKILSKDNEKLRGTFIGADRTLVAKQVYDPIIDGIVTVTLGDNKIDKYLTGIDATDGSKVVNYGNYGVLYKIVLPVLDDNKAAFYLNPRGGVYAGVVGVNNEVNKNIVIPTPANRLFFGEETSNNDFTKIGSTLGGEKYTIFYSSPGASNLPVKLILYPERN